MKQIHMLFLSAFALFAASCSQDLAITPDEPAGNPVVLRATIEGSGTRAAIDQGKVNWQADDAISVRLSNNSNLTMKVTNESAGKAEATFTGVIVGDAKIVAPTVAVYPAGNHNLVGEAAVVNMPTEYTVADNANTNMPMICEFDGNGVGTFKHLGGVMQFKIGMYYVPAGAAKFRFTAKDNQNITGDFTVADGVITATAGDGSKSSVTINFNADQIDPTEKVLTVNVPLPVGTYVGMDLDILDASGNKLMNTFGSTATNTVERTKRIVMPKLTPVELHAGTEGPTVRVHNTAEAQAALDAATSGTTIILEAGNYEELVLRHTKATTEIKDANGNVDENGKYYHRTLENFTIKAAEGATVTVAGINISSGHVHTADASNPAYNYVVGDGTGVAIQSTNVYNYYAHFDLKNFVIDGINLTKQINIGCDSNTEDNQIMKINGFTILNCQMTGTKTDKNCRFLRIGNHNVNNSQQPDCANGHRLENILVKNCTIKQVYQVMYAYGKADVTFEDCHFEETGHNVLSVGGGKNTFQRNTFKNITYRLLRVTSTDYPADDWIRFLNNTIIDSPGKNGVYYESETSGVNITFSGNTKDGQAWSSIQ